MNLEILAVRVAAVSLTALAEVSLDAVGPRLFERDAADIGEHVDAARLDADL